MIVSGNLIFAQVNTCLIGGNCYADGEVNPENPFESCDAVNNATEWSGVATGSTVTGSAPTGITATSGVTSAPGECSAVQ